VCVCVCVCQCVCVPVSARSLIALVGIRWCLFSSLSRVYEGVFVHRHAAAAPAAALTWRRAPAADVPAGDVLCHTGDFELRGSRGRCCSRDVDRFARFLSRQPHAHKLVVAGNHDRTVFRLGKAAATAMLRGHGVTYLQNEHVVACGLTFFGCPFSPASSSPNSAFQVSEAVGAQMLAAQCPPSVDVLLTHANGRDAFRRIISSVRPRVHAFGHFHDSCGVWREGLIGGRTVLCVNSSVCDELYRAVQPLVVLDVFPMAAISAAATTTASSAPAAAVEAVDLAVSSL
jgi:hypothetical protein